MEKFEGIYVKILLCAVAVMSVLLAVFFAIFDDGNREHAFICCLLAGCMLLMMAIVDLREEDATQQTQIDDLKRELEEMKGKMKE